MRMLADYILVNPDPWPEQRQGTILIPRGLETEKRFARGEVKGVGPGLCLANGDHSEVEVDPGDAILYFKVHAADIVVDGINMHIIQEREVLAILESGDFTNQGDETNATS